MFEGASDLTNIIFGDTFKTANVTNMKAMFNGCLVIQPLNGSERF